MRRHGTGCMVMLDAKGADNGQSARVGFSLPIRVPPLTSRITTICHYGFWLKKTTDEDGVLTYNEVETFAGSSLEMPDAVSDVRDGRG